MACSATPVRATFPALAGAQNSVTGRPRDTLEGAGRNGARGGARTAFQTPSMTSGQPKRPGV